MSRLEKSIEKTRHALLGVLSETYGASGACLAPIYVEPDQAIYRVDRTDGPSWVARHFSATRSRVDVAGDADVLRMVRHLPVEQIINTQAGDGYAFSSGRGVIVTEFERGPIASSTVAPRLLLEQVGAILGAVHQLTQSGATATMRRAGSLPREDLELGRRYLSEITDRVPADQRADYDRLDRALAATNDCETLPVTLVHSDCHLGNVVQSARGPVMIDWHSSGLGPAVASLGWLLYSGAVQSPGGRPAPFDPTRVDAILDGYSRHRKLNRLELDHLTDAVRYRPLVIAARALNHSIQSGDKTAANGWWSRYTEAVDVARRVTNYATAHGWQKQ